MDGIAVHTVPDVADLEETPQLCALNVIGM
jgi:hypothetical protein